MDSGAEVLRQANAFKKDSGAISVASSDQFDEKHRSLLQQFLTQAAVASMNSKNGIDDVANRLSHRQNGLGSGGSFTPTESKAETKSWTNGQSVPPEPLAISNNTPSMQLSCVECGVSKTNSEEMEIHIKTEHLNWLPFQCPICLTERASDAQMREHLHSSHKKSMNKFIYVDNVQAKRQLQMFMDKAFSMNVTKRVTASTSALASPSYVRASSSTPSSGRNTSTSATSTAAAAAQATASAIVAHHKEKEKQQAQAAADFLKLLEMTEPSIAALATEKKNGRKRPYSESPAEENEHNNGSLTENLLSSITNAVKGNEENDKPSFSLDDLNIDSSSALASLFDNSKKIKTDDNNLVDTTMDDALDALNPISVLDNVAALFGTPAIVEKAPEDGKKTSSVSKKRVLGECSKCQKPVTAGARQMHMFYHLAKDENIFRFRCKFEGCTTEHYRKDQMENHQSKVHGRIEPDMMEDRSLELFQKCQELNHELFIAHRNQARSSPHWTSSQMSDAQGSKSKGSSSLSSSNGSGILKLLPYEDHPLQCRLCGKTMQNRIRGFHILWHMAKDRGINRYTCKYCDFGHDRSQSVQVHGKKEHGSEDCVEDRIAEYQDDVKEMSEACFGISSLFSQESKRKSKIPAAAFPREKEGSESASGNASPSILLEDEAVNVMEEESEEKEVNKETEDEEDESEQRQEEEDEDESDDEENNEASDGNESTPAGSAKRKRRENRRFNVRPRKTKKQMKDALVMRSISMMIGGAQFFRKKINEFCYCEKCGKMTNNKLPEHAYTHMETDLFLCPCCDMGHQLRDTVLKHMREVHPNEADKCIDNRLLNVAQIKETIRECYPAFFVDMPLPTETDVLKIAQLVKGEETQIAGIEEYLEKVRDEK